jgi:hypothetical protein
VLRQLSKLQSLAVIRIELYAEEEEGDNDEDESMVGFMCGGHIKKGVITDSLMQLSALTALTSLQIVDGDGAGLTDDLVGALASSLTQLQTLYLVGEGMRTWSALPAIAQLTGLRSLRLLPIPCEAAVYVQGKKAVRRFKGAELRQLSTLTRLTELQLPLQGCSDWEWKRLLCKLPSLQVLMTHPGNVNML